MTHVRRPNRRRDPAMVGAIEGDLCAASGKVRYLDERSASAARDQVARHDPGRLNVYRCAACGAWHFGHSER